jgi:hypothetical protein
VLSCVGRVLASCLSPVQGVLPNVELVYNFKSNSELEYVTRSKRIADDDDDDDDDELT